MIYIEKQLKDPQLQLLTFCFFSLLFYNYFSNGKNIPSYIEDNAELILGVYYRMKLNRWFLDNGADQSYDFVIIFVDPRKIFNEKFASTNIRSRFIHYDVYQLKTALNFAMWYKDSFE